MKSTKKTKTTVTLRRGRYGRFQGLIKELGLRRDTYLNNVLPGEVRELGRIDANSREAEEWLCEVFERHSPGGSRQANDLIRVNLNLDSELVSEMNAVCTEKRVPRDIFLEAFLDHATSALDLAADHIANPHANDPLLASRKSHYDDLHYTDKDVEYYRQQQQEDLLVIEAIARLKQTTVGATAEAFARCNPAQKDTLRIHPDVIAEMQAMQGTDEAKIANLDFSDLLDGDDPVDTAPDGGSRR